MFEHTSVQAGDVDGGEHRGGANDDGPEQELVLPNIREKGERARIMRVDAEHAAPHGLEFPGGNQNQPSQLGKHGGAGTEHNVAAVAVFAVTVDT
ncbi:hypothetical protein KCU88_g367, partial [Aureobasidium melanogenum]